MRLLGGGVATLVAGAIGLLVIGDAVLSLAGVFGDAGWYGIVVLAFPLLVALAAWRGWGSPSY